MSAILMLWVRFPYVRPEDGTYLVSTIAKQVQIATYADGDWYDHKGNMTKYVIAFMPLPPSAEKWTVDA